MILTVDNQNRYISGRQIKTAEVMRRCPHCGMVLYEKLGRCDGNIKIKCQKCGRLSQMNLALRKLRS